MARSLAAAFVAGAAVMGVEILASRWLAPAFGFTLTTWSWLIAVTLLAGAIGAGLGGWERVPGRNRTVAVLLFGAALWCVLVTIAAPRVLDTDRVLALPLSVGGLLSALVLVGPPVMLASAVLPLLVRSERSGAAPGRTVARLLAVSTLGSLAGTLGTALLLVPQFGLARSGVAVAVLAAAAGAPFLAGGGGRSLVLPTIFGVGATVALLLEPGLAGEALGNRRLESAYGRIDLEGVGGGQSRVRVNGVVQAGVSPWVTGRGALLRHRQYFELLPFLRPAGRRALVVGLGAGVVPRALAEYDVEVEAIELDPELIRLARQAFGHEGVVHAGDGRAVWRRLGGARYDFLVLDVFRGEALPGHLLTREAFSELRELRESDGAVLCVHIIGRPDHRVTGAVHATLRADHEHVLAVRSGAGNELQDLFLFASDRPLPVPPFPELRETGWLGNERFEPPAGAILRDDRNPIEVWNEPLARELRRRGRAR